ncbi:conserved hypothetical protein [Aspergillus terreus NIH2624]|uniref:Utp8 beta-propeller domain-containing protein n=1 Tax=Aspergillus terreus (strain NIH 2624 / FGSC A1156) TaxID=341663 RepID=Q0C8F8_ASPTN|nr:uncharacterized protein ATEG_10026 [Aspergillus terreus NIH2624]EAU29475.1 conserved hypothetical protein [Aspergillus terreus NIH2624]
MDLQPPSVLAQLPRPLHASTGKTRIGEVFRLADSKKRKRYEVAVAVDGEAVNIYNIQTPKLVTSYAVPPKSSFTCQPCSVRRKLSNKSTVKRQTYVAINPQREIKSFVEEHGGSGSSAPVITSSSFSAKDSDSPAIFVGILPTVVDEEEEKDPFDILTVHKDGRVRRLSAGLDAQRWSLHHSELAKLSSTQEIRSCFLVEFEEARKTLFKKRQDLAALAQADITDSGVDHTSVLLLVSQPHNSERFGLNEVKVHMFSVPGTVPAGGLTLDESQKMRHLLTVNLPNIEGHDQFERDRLQWDFHSGSAGLNLSFERGFINVDLSQYTPTVTSRFILDNEEFSSVLRVSPQSVVGAGKSTIAVFDTQYNSVQRSIPISNIPASTDTRTAPTTFIGYFAKLGLAVAIRGNTLIAFDLSSSRTPLGSSLKRSRDGLLIDAIGRGIGASAQWDPSSKKPRMESLGLTPEQSSQWNDFSRTLQEASQAKDTAAFDRAVQKYFSAGSSNGLAPRSHYVNPELTLFLLSFIFTLHDSPPADHPFASLARTPTAHLSVGFWPEATCQWLIDRGHLSRDNVETAVRRAIKPRILPGLPPDALVQALIDSDPTYLRLVAVLQGPVLLSPDDLASALKTLLNAARTQSVLYDSDLSDAASNSSFSSPATLQTIFLGLNTSLQKLHAYPAAVRTASLRAALHRLDIVGLIHHLRLSLATGGYTSRFTETPPTAPTPFQTNPSLSLDVIADCLNAAVDAVGPSGWIAAAAPTAVEDGLSVPSAERELITDLQAEISAALAGVEEAAYLRGVLREYLRYTESVQQSMARSKSVAARAEKVDDGAGSTPLVRHEKLNGADLLVFGAVDAADGDEADATGRMLPLSLKAPATDVSKTKVKKSTGEVKTRSSREIGYLRRKAAGKYSFERLIV